jgi:hypothetical protein
VDSERVAIDWQAELVAGSAAAPGRATARRQRRTKVPFIFLPL